MKRHEEDKLIELAFGEISAEEAETLQHGAQADPHLAETLRTYSEMREGLSALRDIPEMQMSCDRLRDAILAGGLKQKRFVNWSWLAAPTVVAAAAFGITMLMHKPSVAVPGNGIVMGKESPNTSGPVALNIPKNEGEFSSSFDSKTFLGNFGASPKEDGIDRSEPTLRVVHQTGSRRAVRSGSSTEGPLFDKFPKKNLNFAPHEAAPLSGTSGPEMGAQPAMDAALTTASVIVIQPEETSGTGAQKATEVANSNVVIGG